MAICRIHVTRVFVCVEIMYVKAWIFLFGLVNIMREV